MTCRYDDNGEMVLEARLPADAGTLLMKALELAMERRQAEDREATCVPKWYAGDTMDWDLVVGNLFQLEGRGARPAGPLNCYSPRLDRP